MSISCNLKFLSSVVQTICRGQHFALSSSLCRFIKHLAAHRYMIRSMVARDLASRYEGSFMGLFWSVVHPLMMFVTYAFIFSWVFKARLGPQAGGAGFALWLLCGMIPWLFFSDSLVRSSSLLIAHRTLVTKSLFPCELLPVSLVVSNLVNHGILLVLVCVILLASGRPPTLFILFLPLYAIPLTLFILGLSWIAAGVNVFIRDTEQTVAAAVNFWFFYTPIFYEALSLPEPLRFALKLNPLYHIVEGYRLTMLSTGYPPIKGLLFANAAGLLFACAGGLVFKRLKPDFAELL